VGEGDANADTAEPARHAPGPQAPALAVFDQRKSRAAISHPRPARQFDRGLARGRRHCGATLEFELLRDHRFATREQARTAVAGWIDEYNTVRRHSTNNMLSPIDYERTQAQAIAETRSGRRLTTVRWHH
jgi:transposase InsO family protein